MPVGGPSCREGGSIHGRVRQDPAIVHSRSHLAQRGEHILLDQLCKALTLRGEGPRIVVDCLRTADGRIVEGIEVNRYQYLCM
jgi:hypothetical protein